MLFASESHVQDRLMCVSKAPSVDKSCFRSADRSQRHKMQKQDAVPLVGGGAPGAFEMNEQRPVEAHLVVDQQQLSLLP